MISLLSSPPPFPIERIPAILVGIEKIPFKLVKLVFHGSNKTYLFEIEFVVVSIFYFDFLPKPKRNKSSNSVMETLSS